MNAIAMIARCVFHQSPEEFGRDLVPHPIHTELGPCGMRSPETYATEYALTSASPTWCARCDCDHGDPPMIVAP